MSGNFCFSFVFGYGDVDNEVEHRKNKNCLSKTRQLPLSLAYLQLTKAEFFELKKFGPLINF